ncbi:NADH:flavin oxidoreductase [Haloferax sp. YSMS24]|uniref:oxidoreductase n=1 Tax=Haloferax sp. YSMS24 TaxID=3388425 RepID=UPI00398CC316
MASIRLDDPVEIGGLTLRNRLYRAPLLECAGTGDDAPERLAAELEPAARAGAGLVCQGATIVSETGGCAAPGMTRVADPPFVESLESVTDRIHGHGAAIAVQLEHGGLRSMETWHAGYRRDHPNLQQLAVSRPPRLLRLLDTLGFLDYDAHVLTTDEVYELAADFGRSAALAVDAGYDVVHIAGANMGIVHQFLSPFYNRRDDEFGDGVRFLEVVADEIREQAGDVPLMTKVPAETAAPPGIRPRLTEDNAIDICRRLDDAGYDALVPVSGSVFWDASIVRGSFPARAWHDDRYRDGYADAFGGRIRARLVELGNRLEATWYEFEPAWNAELCRRVRDAVSVPVFCEGGIRERGHIDTLLGDACDAVGMARPFYAEPELPARLLGTNVSGDERVVCESCNNCAVPQVTGAAGVCRTPSVLRRAGSLKMEGAYDEAPEMHAGDADDPVG